MFYEYQCSCGHIFTQYNTVKNRHNAECPNCKSSDVKKLITTPETVTNPCKYRDLKGTPIWFPKDGKPYFDKALRRTFKSAKEKKDYMDNKKIIMDGSSTASKMPIEAGDVRNKSYRKEKKLED